MIFIYIVFYVTFISAGAGGYAGLAGMMIAEAGRCGELQCRVSL